MHCTSGNEAFLARVKQAGCTERAYPSSFSRKGLSERRRSANAGAGVPQSKQTAIEASSTFNNGRAEYAAVSSSVANEAGVGNVQQQHEVEDETSQAEQIWETDGVARRVEAGRGSVRCWNRSRSMLGLDGAMRRQARGSRELKKHASVCTTRQRSYSVQTDATVTAEQIALGGQYAEELHAACDAVRLAGTLCDRAQLSLLRREVHAGTKDDSSLVTLADYGAQAIISHVLQQRFGDDVRMVAEESSEALREGGEGGTDMLKRVAASVNDALQHGGYTTLSSSAVRPLIFFFPSGFCNSVALPQFVHPLF